ncbi:uncharacterized protein LOC126845744 [Adelges cooleyi]|uniref:uncharacterized protein LOC126845744 n=1 Tax=Adelges cooleyi TaxID=133065 RepID=UPI00218036DA|nr:uncharacterized protein LOC126845744 [Adelges cooleyi]
MRKITIFFIAVIVVETSSLVTQGLPHPPGLGDDNVDKTPPRNAEGVGKTVSWDAEATPPTTPKSIKESLISLFEERQIPKDLTDIIIRASEIEEPVCPPAPSKPKRVYKETKPRRTKKSKTLQIDFDLCW